MVVVAVEAQVAAEPGYMATLNPGKHGNYSSF